MFWILMAVVGLMLWLALRSFVGGIAGSVTGAAIVILPQLFA